MPGLFLGVWVVAAAPGSAKAEDDPPRVLTQTPEYCLQLESLLGDVARRNPFPLPGEVQALADDGQLMCERGQIRGGIARLRRALIMLRETQGGG